jgi:hypothetical protein
MKRKPRTPLVAAVIAVAGLAIVGAIATTASAGTAALQRQAVTPVGPGGTWGSAQTLNGVYGDNVENAPVPGISSLSCTGAGDCSAIGNSEAASDSFGAFGVSQVNGVWGHLEHLSGIPFFDDSYGTAAISCTAPGNCTAGGTADGKDGKYAVVISQVNGVWDKAQPVNTQALSGAVAASWLYALSCSSAGNCAATGMITPGGAGGVNESFLVTEKDGTWGAAQAARGTFGNIVSMSCGATGDCAASGIYLSGPGGSFVVIEKNGTWGDETAIPGPNTAVYSDASCSGATCTLAGNYETLQGTQYFEHFFAVSETNGIWGTLTSLSTVKVADAVGIIDLLSCPGTGSCALVASVTNEPSNAGSVFALTEKNGTWGTPRNIVGATSAYVSQLSCPSAGDCAVAGSGIGPDGGYFVASEANGVWTSPHAVVIPGAGRWTALSCGHVGYCSAATFVPYGTAPLAGNSTQQYVVSEATASHLALSVSARAVPYGDDGKAVITAKVSGSGGTPTGNVTVSSGGERVCVITLTDGSGRCAPGAASLAAGTHHLTAGYTGDRTYLNSARAVPTITITKASTRTALKLSAARIAFGHDTAEHLPVKVTARFGTTTAGRVTIKAGRTTLCTITLKAGIGRCTLAAKQLKPDTFILTAAYAGSPDYRPSASAARPVTVTK